MKKRCQAGGKRQAQQVNKLLSHISVREVKRGEYILIAGRHRHEAYKQRFNTYVRARIIHSVLPSASIRATLGFDSRSSDESRMKVENASRAEGQAMSSIRDRQEGFEKKFAMDEESKFKAMARRNKLLGLWAAEKLGKAGADADAYAKEVVSADFEEAGDNDVFRKVRADFDAAGVAQSDHQIRSMMDQLLITAVDQIKTA